MTTTSLETLCADTKKAIAQLEKYHDILKAYTVAVAEDSEGNDYIYSYEMNQLCNPDSYTPEFICRQVVALEKATGVLFSEVVANV